MERSQRLRGGVSSRSGDEAVSRKHQSLSICDGSRASRRTANRGVSLRRGSSRWLASRGSPDSTAPDGSATSVELLRQHVAACELGRTACEQLATLSLRRGRVRLSRNGFLGLLPILWTTGAATLGWQRARQKQRPTWRSASSHSYEQKGAARHVFAETTWTASSSSFRHDGRAEQSETRAADFVRSCGFFMPPGDWIRTLRLRCRPHASDSLTVHLAHFPGPMSARSWMR